ncbi:Mss4-like protein [Xylariales sp. PMI_506]|nr:Mss4-like protein [Xylariales sp. PMI_506]
MEGHSGQDVKEEAEQSSPQGTGDRMNKQTIYGSCICGFTKWQSSHLPSRGSFCYCQTCRKMSGGAFLAFMDFPVLSITFSPPITSPKSTLKWTAVSKNAERGFCSACGSTLTFRYHATPDTLYLTIASVDERARNGAVDPLKSLSKKHIYVGEKVDWYDLPDDGLPRFETMPNEAKYLIFGEP